MLEQLISKLPGEPFYLTMSYFLPVSYLLVQGILIILPENVKLHMFLRVYAQQVYQRQAFAVP